MLSLSSSLFSPTLSPSPCAERALLPVLPLKWDTLSSLCFLSGRMNGFNDTLTLDSDLGKVTV